MHSFVKMFSNNFVLPYMKTLRWHALIIFCNFFFFTKRHLLIFSYSSSTCCLFVTIPDLLCTGHCHSQWRGTTKSQVELEGMENLPSADCIIPSESEWFVMFPVWSMKIYIILSYLYCLSYLSPFVLLKAFHDILINEVSLSEELVVIVTRKLIGISFIFAPDFRLERDQVFFLIKKGIKEKKVEV